jgi:hypothetical protein
MKLKNITLKNFLSIGSVCQAISFERANLTLVLGENLDLGGSGHRNGVGKCVSADTEITVRNKKTGKVEKVAIVELYLRAKLAKPTDDNA